jgi:ssDNA thymidine ADP-ribosyltransferase, DarT
VTRDELRELGYIVPIATIPSILRRGILSHRRAQDVAHDSIALEGVQERRARVIVPNGRPLHEYVNLYICARNPMLFKRQDIHAQICVLRISSDVLDIANVVVSDSNAGTKFVRFGAAPGGLSIVDRERTFARYWNHPEDEREHRRHSAQKCAEVLIPDVVPTRYIVGAYVSCEESQQALVGAGFKLPVTRNRDLFFR